MFYYREERGSIFRLGDGQPGVTPAQIIASPTLASLSPLGWGRLSLGKWSASGPRVSKPGAIAVH